MGSVNITDTQQVPLAVAELDAAGNPVGAIQPDTWASSDPSIVTVAADPNDPSGLGAVATAVGPTGTATCTVSVQPPAAADGTSPPPVTASIDVVVGGDQLAQVTITPGSPTPKAPAGP